MLNSRHNTIYPYDIAVFAYCALMILLILALGRPVSTYYDELVFYAVVILLAWLIVKYLREDRGSAARFVRILYPAIMFTFFYRMTGGTMTMLFHTFYDWQLTSFEKSIIGINPTLFIDRYLLNVWATEILSLAYFAYYPMIPVFVLTLYFRKDYAILKSFLTTACITFFFSYVLFFIYPIEGPRWYFADTFINDVYGPVFRKAVEFVIAKGAVRGGCMPSTHFAVALVILMYCFKHFKNAAMWMLPVVAGLALGTFWGRFHYISDVVVGGLIGAIATLLVWKYFPLGTFEHSGITKQPDPVRENVS